jgi:hypothetical protein
MHEDGGLPGGIAVQAPSRTAPILNIYFGKGTSPAVLAYILELTQLTQASLVRAHFWVGRAPNQPENPSSRDAAGEFMNKRGLGQGRPHNEFVQPARPYLSGS